MVETVNRKGLKERNLRVGIILIVATLLYIGTIIGYMLMR
jgi:hypothetical protein